ncbi:hypothetical protein F3F93_11305 [Mariprofundus sp. KV]|nr:hypothetical protein [Mariprofundus sp. KV]
MAMSVQPVDGLIHRLLQQNARPSSAPDRSQEATKPASDHVSLSVDARPSQSDSVKSELPARLGEKALESHLLNLYRSNDKFGG